jgi:hypothetical protein
MSIDDATPEEWDALRRLNWDYTKTCGTDFKKDTIYDEYLPKGTTAFKTQVGGSHYKDFKIQPTEYILANNLGFLEGNVIKYVTRYKSKNGVEDIDKAIHYLQILKESLNDTES